MMRNGSVEPIGQRRIRRPRMFWPDVIRHDVEQHFHFLRVRGVDQFLIIAHRSEMRLDCVQIDGAVAVVILGRAIFHNRREPKRRDTETF